VEAACRSYFGYSAASLTQAQAALLAVLPQAPSRYRPDRHPKRAERQRNKVLDRLVRFGVLSKEEAADAKLESVTADAPGFDTAAPLLARRLTQNGFEASLLISSIDRDIQLALESIARRSIHRIPERTSLAIMVMAHGTGRVVGYVGSADFLDPNRFGHVDMVTARRSPGSTLKPFIYGMALDRGLIHSQSLLMDVPLQFGDYRPRNFQRGFTGPVSARDALKRSLNLPAVQLLDQVGADVFYARMQTAGADLHLPRGAVPNLAMALGGVAVNLEHLVQLYSALGNSGDTIAPRFTPTEPLRRRKLLSPGAAWIVRDMLTRRDGEEEGVFGLAVKTGTSFGARDAWALAVSEHYTVGVWVGSPDNAAMVGHFGSFTAVPILRSVVAMLPPTDHRVHDRPLSVSRAAICWPGGQSSDTRCDQRRTAWILEDTFPRTLMSTSGQSPLIPKPEITLRIAADTGLRVPMGCAVRNGRITVPVWPDPLQNWIAPDFRNSSRIPALDPRCTNTEGLLAESPVQIVGLDRNDRVRGHATTQEKPMLRVLAMGGQPEWYWFLNGELLDETGSFLKLPLPRPGRYQLVVTDQAGMSDRVEFFVD
jgi:penicillin-binding protein 1C